MTTLTLPVQPSFLKRKFLGIPRAALLVIAIMGLSLILHLYDIESIGNANAYYTAAVESMLKSWSNFFFVAAEPGGSVTVDKPPLGLWIEAVFAYFLGVSGFSVSLPNILAGVFGIPVLYHLVRRYAGELAGLIAALVMAITPVFVATNRNNTMDGMLVFTLLLAAWAFIHATETGKTRWLMLGAFIVGLGFNIKMMQALLPLPAFYALYFLASKEGWLRKTVKLGIATIVLLAVSLSWAVAVDLTPADQRPYIGSSGNNTVMGLIFGHNGISRLENSRAPGGGGGPQSSGTTALASQTGAAPSQSAQPQEGPRNGPPQEALDACANAIQGAACSFVLPNRAIEGTCVTPPNLGVLACAPADMIQQNGQAPANGQVPNSGPDDGQGGGSQFSRETGEPGILRFFTDPLSRQMSWLLPFALISILLALFGSRVRLPLESDVHKALILWGGWLLICVVFFSMVSGIFHAYYAIMLAPALGAMVGIGFAELWNWDVNRKSAGILLIGAVAITLAFQLFASYQYGEMSIWVIAAGILLVAGSMLMVVVRHMAYVTLLAAMLIIPMYWTVMTVASNPDINLPTAYAGSSQQTGLDGVDRARQEGDDGRGSQVNEELIAYLQENTRDVDYLVAVPSSQQGAPLVLATGRPVLYMGGFGGQDEVVSADDLNAMVANKELLYVLYGGDRMGQVNISNWLDTSCFVIQQFNHVDTGHAQPQQEQQNGTAQNADQPGPRNQTMSLYMCH